MIRFTDARLVFSIDGVNLDDATDIHVSFRQWDTLLDITDIRIVDGAIIVDLTQGQTKMFLVSSKLPIMVQVNMRIGGKRVATNIAKIDLTDNLLREDWE